MRVCLLGDVAVVNDSTWAPIRAPRLQRIVATLALRPGVVTLDALADVVWPDEQPTNWKPALRNAVAKLRRDLEAIGAGGQELITTTAAGYRLGAGHTVDVHAMISDIEEAVSALETGDPDRAVDLAATASAMSGPGLAAALDVDRLLPYRTQVEIAHLRALDVAAAASMRTGRSDEAARFAERAIERDPLREQAHRQLIAAQLAGGDRAAALRAYDRCRRTLADELGIVPDDHTQALYRTALGTDSGPSGRIDRHAIPLAGRVSELDELSDWVRTGGVVVIAGHAGVGKSRLAHETARRLRDRFDGGRFEVDLESVGEHSALAAVAAAIGVDIPHDAGNETIGQALAPRGPVLLVLDGADRCTDAVVALATDLLVTAPDTAVIVTTRQSVALPSARKLHVGGLEPAYEGPALFRANADAAGVSLPDSPEAEATLVELCRSVDGNPLAIALLARFATVSSLGDLGDLLERGRTVPLTDVIQLSIDLLDETERHVLGRLAVVNGAVDLHVAQAVVTDAGLSAARVTRVLAQLADRGLVQLDRGEVRWRYELHPAIRSASLALLGGEIRPTYDRLTAAIFAALPPNATRSPPMDTIRSMLPAMRGVFDAALNGAADIDQVLRLAFWVHRYWALTGIDEGVAWLTRLLALGGSDPLPHSGTAEYALGYLLVWAGRPEAAAAHLETAGATLTATDDPMAAAALYYLAGCYDNRRPDLARANYERAAAVATRQGNPMLAAICTEGIGTIECEAGDFDAGLARFRASLDARRELGGDELFKVALPSYAQHLFRAGRVDEADRALREAEQLLADEARIATIVASSVRAAVERVRGRRSAARRHALRAAAVVESTGARRLEAMPQSTLAMIELDDGDPAAAATRLASAAKVAAEVDAPWLLADVLDAATIVASTAGRHDHAARLAGAADAQRVRAYVVRGRPDQAEFDQAVEAAGSPSWDVGYQSGLATESAAAVDLVVALAGSPLTVG